LELAICGIHGVIRFPRLVEEDFESSKRALHDLFHRGPDSQEQEKVDDLCILGNVRLAIIDIASSHQPLVCNCGHHSLTFNGEIFNYKELRSKLNYNFRTEGDTETLLALLCTLGIDYIHLLRGQFAFAVWDSSLKQLSLAVDRFGVLPLYFSDSGGRLEFSSVASAIAKNGKALDSETLTNFLYDRSITAPETPYIGIRRIPPGEVWTFSENSLQVKNWTLNLKKSTEKNVDPKELVKLLNQAADRIVVSDVEIGIFFSGGLDSSLAAKLIQDRVPFQLKAYTAAWNENDYSNEDESSSRNAKLLGLQHHVVKITAADWWRAMESGSKFRDSPMSEASDPAFYLLAERANKDVKVITTGEGADELFCGYPKYRAELISDIVGVRSSLKPTYKLLKHHMSEKMERLLYSTSRDSQSLRYSSYFATRWQNDLTPPIRAPMNFQGLSSLDACRNWDIKHYLPSVLLDRADKMAMANSIEVRPLFLDSDLADYALSIPARVHLNFFSTKILLREAAKEILPTSFSEEKKKGFPTPLGLWLRSELFEPVRNVFLEGVVSEYLPITTREMVKLLDEHRRGKYNHTRQLFTLLSLALWLRE
jgi:asparagine synthase (glutamine-hydrolysing)